MSKPLARPGQADDLSRFVWTGQAGDFVFHAHDDVTDLFIVEEGRIELIVGESGSAPRVLAELGPGDSFGEGALADAHPSDLAARVAADCRLLKIDYATFVALVQEQPSIAMHLLRRLSQRLDDRLRAALHASATAAATASAAPGVPEDELTSTVSASGLPSSAPLGATAWLVHAKTGTEFAIAGEAAGVGRVDRTTGLAPEIDLTQIDRQRTVSRRHARIRREGDGYTLREDAGVSNGTFVNGQRVQAGVDVALRDGDRVRFGLVDTIFRRL